MAMTEKTKTVFQFLQENQGKNLTAADVAEATGLNKRQVDGIFTRSIQAKNFGVRIPAEVELEDGTHKAIKLLTLTEEGMAVDLNAAE